MINKIEDLKNTWVSTSNRELVDLYAKKSLSLGAEINRDADSAADKGYSCVYMMGSGMVIGAGSYPLGNSSYKELTLSDLKPRTKTEFVQQGFHKCHEAMFKHEMEEELYISSHNGFIVASMSNIIDNWRTELYRKVETEIDERQEFIDTAVELLNRDDHGGEASHYEIWFGAMFDSGKFKLVE